MTDVNVSMSVGVYDGLRKAVKLEGSQVIETLKESGLRGRGRCWIPYMAKNKVCFRC